MLLSTPLASFESAGSLIELSYPNLCLINGARGGCPASAACVPINNNSNVTCVCPAGQQLNPAGTQCLRTLFTPLLAF